MIVDTPAELQTLFAASLFDTPEAAASNADMHMSYPVTVWRLPTGQYVWAMTDTQEVVTDLCGLVLLGDLCVGDGTHPPSEVMTRDFGVWDVLAV